ncbi:MAG: restriction endonuclease subunit S [Chlorobium sp.]|jgi:type I restriction enzyme S subunit|nr:restriction endonuclease subunit S [Chlorobium sp.]
MSAEVKTGYKLTEVGVIPEDWEVRRIGELKPFITSGSRGWAEFYSDRGAPFIRITNLVRTSIFLDLKDLRLVNLPKDASEGTRTQLHDDDVLISITADIGIISYVSPDVPKPAYINQHIALVRFDASTISPKFVAYFLASDKPQKLFRALTDSGAKAGMSLLTVQNVLLAFPPTKTEQEATAEVLSDADALIASLEQLIAKKRQIKQGAMQELLTGKKRLPGFSGEWVEKTLGEIATIKTGSSNNQDKNEDGEYPFFVRSNHVERINSYSHDCEAILIPGEGGIGSIFHYINGRFDVHQRVYAITKFVETVSGLFVFYYMVKNFGAHAMQNSVKATVDSLRLPTFQNFEMLIPVIPFLKQKCYNIP